MVVGPLPRTGSHINDYNLLTTQTCNQPAPRRLLPSIHKWNEMTIKNKHLSSSFITKIEFCWAAQTRIKACFDRLLTTL